MGVDEPDGNGPRSGGYRELTLPYGAGYACEGALLAQRYFHDTGATRNELAQIALTARAHAAGNPAAVYREPLTLSDYLAAPPISTPLCVYDCDPTVDGAIAVILSAQDAARGPHPPVRLEALGLCPPGGGAAFVRGGGRIALDGELPLNTGGGQLSGGRLHGYIQLYEACVQLRGEGGVRQVHPRPRLALAAVGAGHFTGCVLLSTRA